MRFKGKVVVVTGAGRNIGRTLCLAFAQEGASVAVNVRQNRAEGEEVSRAVQALGVPALLVVGDVAKREDVQRMKEEVLATFNHVDVLINNAGVRPHSAFLEMDDAEWDWVLGVNLHGPYHMAKAFAPSMAARQTGCIINVSGQSGFEGKSHRAHVVASKAGLYGFTKALAHDLGPHGIRVNTLVPSSVKDTSRPAAWYPNREEEERRVLKSIPLGRHARATDISSAALFLASEDAGFVTGQALHVNGGKHMV